MWRELKIEKKKEAVNLSPHFFSLFNAHASLFPAPLSLSSVLSLSTSTPTQTSLFPISSNIKSLSSQRLEWQNLYSKWHWFWWVSYIVRLATFQPKIYDEDSLICQDDIKSGDFSQLKGLWWTISPFILVTISNNDLASWSFCCDSLIDNHLNLRMRLVLSKLEEWC